MRAHLSFKTYLAGIMSIALAILSVSTAVQASTTSPKVLLEDTTREMIHALNQDSDKLKKDPQKIRNLVEKLLLPHIDLIASSRWVLGKHWRRAEKQQKLGFIREFRTMLLRFYSSALVEYLQTNTIDQNIITFLPLRDQGDKKDVTVRSEVHAGNGKTIPVNYRMHLTKKGWKVYDVSVEGISVITTYRTSFANEIKTRGVDGLIALLAEKNAHLIKPSTHKNN